MFATVAVGCSGSEPEGEADRTDSAWIRVPIGTGAPAADSEVAAVPFGDGIAGLTVEDPTALFGFVLAADGAVRGGPVVVDPAGHPQITAITDGPKGLVATGNHVVPNMQNFVLTSQDGVTWTETAATGLDVPMDVAELAATEERYIAVGAFRNGDDPASPEIFTPTILTSEDGTAWQPAQMPPFRGGGSIRSVVALDDGLLATGMVGVAPVMWRSVDDGLTWTTVADAPHADEVAATEDALLASSHARDGVAMLEIHRSGDGGRNWDLLDAGFEDEIEFPAVSADNRGFAIIASKGPLGVLGGSSLAPCYAEPAACEPIYGADDWRVLASEDGTDWSRVDLTGLDGIFRPRSLLHDASGDTVVLGETVDAGWAAWIWDAEQGAVPTTNVSEPVPVFEGPPFAEHGATLEEGVRHAYPLYIHCGMGRLGELNGVEWGLVDPPTSPTPLSEDWPMAWQSILGYVTLVSPDRIEYSLEDGEVIGVYAPLPPDTELFPCL